MSREESLEIARRNHAAHTSADAEHLFGRGSAFDAEKRFGFRNGWYHVGGYAFDLSDLTGEPYDSAQGGFAYCD